MILLTSDDHKMHAMRVEEEKQYKTFSSTGREGKNYDYVKRARRAGRYACLIGLAKDFRLKALRQEAIIRNEQI